MRNAIHFNDGATASLNAGAGHRILFEDGLSSLEDAVVEVHVNEEAGAEGDVFHVRSGEPVRHQANTTVYGGTFSVSNGASYGYRSSDWSAEDTALRFHGQRIGDAAHKSEQSALSAADVKSFCETARVFSVTRGRQSNTWTR